MCFAHRAVRACTQADRPSPQPSGRGDRALTPAADATIHEFGSAFTPAEPDTIPALPAESDRISVWQWIHRWANAHRPLASPAHPRPFRDGAALNLPHDPVAALRALSRIALEWWDSLSPEEQQELEALDAETTNPAGG